MEINLMAKSVYGNMLYYPACENSKVIASIAGCKTITTRQIIRMGEAGWKVKITGDHFAEFSPGGLATV